MLCLDNQQTTSVGWFCGILEGEGSFRNTAKSNIEVRISNTDKEIILTCIKFLNQNNIIYSLSDSMRMNRKREHIISIRNSREMLENYPQLLYNVVESKMDCRLGEYQQILGISETTREPSIDVDWLIGIFEAEGSFSVIENCRGCVAFNIEIGNTNSKILSKIAINLRTLGCSWHTREIVKKSEKHTQSFAFNIYGMKRCRRFLLPLKNKWISKRNQKRTSLMLEFIESRFSKPQKDHYSEREYQIIQTMGDLNR